MTADLEEVRRLTIRVEDLSTKKVAQRSPAKYVGREPELLEKSFSRGSDVEGEGSDRCRERLRFPSWQGMQGKGMEEG